VKRFEEVGATVARVARRPSSGAVLCFLAFAWWKDEVFRIIWRAPVGDYSRVSVLLLFYAFETLLPALTTCSSLLVYCSQPNDPMYMCI
jgi:hypothetical protein